MFSFLNFITLGFYTQIIISPKHFQFPGTLTFDRLIDFHDFILIYLIFILAIFLWFLFFALNLYTLFNDIVHIGYTLSFWGTFCSLYYSLIYFPLNNYFTIFEKLKEIYVSPFLTSHNQIFVNYNDIFISIFFHNISFSLDIADVLYSDVAFSDFLSMTRRKVHSPVIELIWTIFPSIILVLIAIPSLYLLYIMDSVEPLSFAIKVVGHQWYWTYEIGSSSPLFKNINNVLYSSFDSYMLSDECTNIRLLDVDNVLFVPANIPLTFFTTSTDVIHSWAVPSLGIKVDAIPGRLNQVCVTIFDINSFYGQCSELCGVNHGFMPINVVSLSDMNHTPFNILEQKRVIYE